jgi:hypothetical protein
VASEYVQGVMSTAVPAYANVKVGLEVRTLSEVTPLARLASSYRLRRADSVLTTLRDAGVAPFEPSYIQPKQGGPFRVSMPPVAELHGERLILIDGLHRAVAARRAGLEELTMVVVSGHLPPVAAEPCSWSSVRVLSTRGINGLSVLLPSYACRRLKFRRYRSGYFRPVGSFLGSDHFCFDTTDEIREHMLSESESVRGSVVAVPFDRADADPGLHYRLSA